MSVSRSSQSPSKVGDEKRSAENDTTYSRVEYGVIVDRTSRGLGYYLAATYRDYDSAKKHAMVSPIRHGYPAEVNRRTVTTTDWTRVTPPGSTDGGQP